MGKRLVFLAPGRVEVRPFDPGAPNRGQIRLKTVVTAISAGTESLLWRGLWPDQMPLDGAWAPAPGSAAYPVSYGYASVGMIEAVGPGVESHVLGRLAFSFTGHQSDVVADLSAVTLLPTTMTADDGVFMASTETALSLAHDAAPVAGETVGVFGLGPIGILTAGILSRFGPLSAWDVVPFRREFAARFGVGTANKPGPNSCDVVLELTGNPHALDEALCSTRFAGRVVLGSWYGSSPVSVTLGGDFHRSRIELVSSQVSTISPSLSGRWTKARRLETVLRMVEALRPSRLITHRFPIDQPNQAYTQACDRPDEGVQVLFTYR